MVLFKPDGRTTADFQSPDALAASFIEMKGLFVYSVELVAEVVAKESPGQLADPKGVGPHGT